MNNSQTTVRLIGSVCIYEREECKSGSHNLKVLHVSHWVITPCSILNMKKTSHRQHWICFSFFKNTNSRGLRRGQRIIWNVGSSHHHITVCSVYARICISMRNLISILRSKRFSYISNSSPNWAWVSGKTQSATMYSNGLGKRLVYTYVFKIKSFVWC